jgi:hypothetical protein
MERLKTGAITSGSSQIIGAPSRSHRYAKRCGRGFRPTNRRLFPNRLGYSAASLRRAAALFAK